MDESIQKEEWSFNTFAWADEQKLPGFGKLLNSWLQVHKTYCNGCRPENSWEGDFKEQSQVGYLSNAGVLIGGIALEEMAVKKKSGDGRNDLFLRLPTLNSTQDYFIEAKFGVIDLTWAEDNVLKKLFQLMGEEGDAIKATKELDPKLLKTHDGKAVAVSFFSLKFEGANTANLDERISDLFNFIQVKQRVQLGLDALASIYFSEKDFQQNREEWKGKRVKANEFVGLILVAKHIDLA